MRYQTLFRDIEKNGDMGYFKDIDWIRVYIISPCTKSRKLLSMLHGPGRLFRDTGVWIMDFGDICRKHYKWGTGSVFRDTGIWCIFKGILDSFEILERNFRDIGIQKFLDFGDTYSILYMIILGILFKIISGIQDNRDPLPEPHELLGMYFLIFLRCEILGSQKWFTYAGSK